MKQLGIHDIILPHPSAILSILEQAGLARTFLCGSVARGEADGISDVDLLIEDTDEAIHVNSPQAKAELEILLGRRVDLIFGAANSLPSHVRESMMGDRIELRLLSSRARAEVGPR